MAYEGTTTIAGLSESDPTGSDPTNFGDDHIRQLKTVLKNIFPGNGGQGFVKPVTASEDEFNALVGVSTEKTIQEQLDDIVGQIGGVPGTLYAPQGTRMLFHQNTAPDGWTSDDTIGVRMCVLVPGVFAGGVAGRDDPTNWTHAHGTQSHQLNPDEIPAHSHNLQGNNVGSAGRLTWDSSQAYHQTFNYTGGSFNNGDTMPTGGSQAHAHGNTLSVNFQPTFAAVMVAVKD